MSTSFVAPDRPDSAAPAGPVGVSGAQEARVWQKTACRSRRDAVRDPLTNLFSRGFFEEALVAEFKRCRRRCTAVGLLFLDLDGFKPLNDGLGHAAGDQLLQEVARVLCQAVRATDVVTRYGGDEFCALVADTAETDLRALADQLLRAVTGLRVERDGKTASVGVSIGAVVCYPRNTTHTYGQFLDAADKAMYAAKAAGKNRVSLVSLVAPDDARFLRAVQERLFSHFLVGRGRVAEQQVHRARPPAAPLQSIGRLARRLGWLGRESSQEVLRVQRQSKKLFGVIALERGFLTEQQVYSLLALQREPPEEVAEALLQQKSLSQAEVQDELRAYYRTVLGVDYRMREDAAPPDQG